MKKHRVFTDTFIAGLKPKATPYKRSESARKGEGRLIVRVLPNGVKEFFYRYRPNGEDKTVSLGRYDPEGKGGGKSLKQVNRDLDDMRGLQEKHGDVKTHLQEQRKQEAIEKRKGTFRQLLNAYVQSLQDAKKPSADEAAGIFKTHVIEPFKVLADTKANEIEPADIRRILARMVKAGITRQVNKARSYLRAAFAHGLESDNDPRTIAHEGVMFGLKINPVSDIKPIKEYERTSERTLSEVELRAYWNALDALPAAQRATLRVNLALAAQRPTQLLRADSKAFDWQENTLLLRDTKGRGGSRDHLLPLTPFVLEQIKPLRELNSDGLLFSSDGKTPMAVETLSKAVAEVSASLIKGHKIEPFGQRDIRRTVETMLQKLKVDKEVRAHLLSHGRSKGVQGKHYERYDFLAEKRDALERWGAHLQRLIAGEPAKVVALRA